MIGKKPKSKKPVVKMNPTTKQIQPNQDNRELPIIMVNDVGRKHILALCDTALKVGGVQNLPGVNMVLGVLRPLPKIEPPTPPTGESNPAEAKK